MTSVAEWSHIFYWPLLIFIAWLWQNCLRGFPKCSEQPVKCYTKMKDCQMILMNNKEPRYLKQTSKKDILPCSLCVFFSLTPVGHGGGPLVYLSLVPFSDFSSQIFFVFGPWITVLVFFVILVRRFLLCFVPNNTDQTINAADHSSTKLTWEMLQEGKHKLKWSQMD